MDATLILIDHGARSCARPCWSALAIGWAGRRCSAPSASASDRSLWGK